MRKIIIENKYIEYKKPDAVFNELCSGKINIVKKEGTNEGYAVFIEEDRKSFHPFIVLIENNSEVLMASDAMNNYDDVYEFLKDNDELSDKVIYQDPDHYKKLN